jgi:hypothetical protein
MDRLMQGAVAASTPAKRPPKTSALLNAKIRTLRDELGLDIEPRDGSYSPVRQQPTPGNALFERIKLLYFQRKDEIEDGLEQVIDEFKQDLKDRLGNSSPQYRTQLLHDRLKDLTWFSKERIRETPLTPYTTPSKSQRPRNARFDSGAPNTGIGFDDQPASPSSRRPTGGIDINAGNHVRQQMLDASSEYGSSFDDHELEQPMEVSNLKFKNALNGLDGTATPKARTAKRRKLNNHRTERLTDLAEEAQANAVGEQMMPDCHWQIRELVDDGFGTRYEHQIDAQSPFARSVERARLRQDAGLEEDVANSVTSHDDVRDMLKSQGVIFNLSSPSIWDSPSQAGGDDFTTSPGPLTGTISLNPKSDMHPLFQLTIHPIVEVPSSRLERRFGSDRFLKVTLPSMDKQLPAHIQRQSEALKSAVQDWLRAPKYLLGRTWRIFNIKGLRTKSSSKRGSKVNDDHLKDMDVYLFATAGQGLTPVSLADLINWHFPMKENAHQSLCKAFARFSLSDKQNTPTVCFRPSQISMVGDILANGEPEDNTFEDPAFQNKPRKIWTTDEVMTDGCALISVGAALLIRETAGIVDFPSVFQGRINGHKGMWHVSGPYETSNPKDLEVWIQLRPSQRKVEIRAEDFSDERCEANRWCFGLITWSRPATNSHIHKDFIPVLEDRGVSRETILSVIGATVDLPIEEIREAVQDTAKFAIWSSEKCGRDVDPPKTTRIGLPKDHFPRSQLLINKTGYTPFTNYLVARSTVHMVEGLLQRMRYSMCFMCIQSTSVYGIVDPYGVLKPGEVHLSISRPLVHESSQQRFDAFAGKDVLVARDPAVRGSDMQRVHCVCHPKLAHLKDIIVMSSRGQIPLAAKLQGGDYDGDTFWVCADERLVNPFRNAPVLQQAGIEELGIEQYKRRLRDIIDEESIGTDRHVDAWLKEVIPFAFREDMVGIVTNYLYKLCYHHKSLWHPHVTLVADLHDAIMDTEKNGYIFGQKEWIAFRQTHKLPDMLSVKRKYLDNLEALNPSTEAGLPKDKATLRHAVSETPTGLRGWSHVLDDIVFNVINPKYRVFLDWLYGNVLNPAEQIWRDSDLEYPLRELQIQAAKADKDFPIDVNREVKAIRESIEGPCRLFAQVWRAHRSRKPTRDESVHRLSECIKAYRDIQPTQDCFFWDMRRAETAPTNWECFKVAVLAGPQLFRKKKGLLFWAAFDVVQYLKSHSENGRLVIEQVQTVLKPKRPKQPKNLLVRDASSSFGSFASTVDDDDDDGDTTNDEDDYGDDGLE